MRRAYAFFLIFALSFAATSQSRLYAQEDSEEDGENENQPALETDWDTYMPDLYSAGDKTFSMALGTTFPTVFLENGKQQEPNLFPVGGIFTLGFAYFFDAHLYLGAEVSGMFIGTLAKHTLYIVPMGLKGGYQFVIGKFEIPLSLMIGGAPTKYLDLGYFGFCMKAEASGYYRFFPSWSFGLNVAWGWYPQTPKDKTPRTDGHLLDITLAARYHF